MSEEATNPAADEELAPVTEGVADEANAQGDDQPQLDEDGNPIEDQADDDSEEIDYEGAKYKLPKALAKEFQEGTLRQADYTRKTQEVAAERKALEARSAELAQQAEIQSEVLEQRVQLKQVETALQQFAETDWTDFSEKYGPQAVASRMAQWQQLRDAHGELSKDITQKEQEFRLSRERASVTALQEADQALSRELPGYGQELVQSVAKVAASVGFTADEVRESLIGADGKADTRSFKLLARLHAAETELSSLKAKTKTAQQVEKQTSVQPARTVGQKAGGYKPGLDDNLPIEEWARRRNAQLAKQRAG